MNRPLVLLSLSLQMMIGSAALSQETPVEEGSKNQTRDYEVKVKRSYNLRHLKNLEVINRRGGIELRGWSQDRVEVTLVKRTVAPSFPVAEERFKAIDVRKSDTDGKLSISVNYGVGLDIQERIQERKVERAHADLIVRAPKSMKVTAWSERGDVLTSDWLSNVVVRTGSGAITLTNITCSDVRVTTSNGALTLTNVEADLHLKAGDQDVNLEKIRADRVFVETRSGGLVAKDVSGGQSYVTGSGSILGELLKGPVKFNSRSGKVSLSLVEGRASGLTESGAISITNGRWEFDQESIIESQKGSIEVRVARDFAAEIDLGGVTGGVQVDFPITPLRISSAKPDFETASKNRVRGKIREGRGFLRLFSREGQVRLGPK